jgi:hypothetical protein
MVKLLDQYSERLVNILDEKIAASLAIRVRENSEEALSRDLASPTFARDDKNSRTLPGDNTVEETDGAGSVRNEETGTSPER